MCPVVRGWCARACVCSCHISETLHPGRQSAAIQKMVVEFQYIRAHSVEPLSTFMDFITVEYMIDNVMMLLKGTLGGRDVNELMEQCHPLGMFKESTMRLITTFEASSKGYADLYQTVLIETPVGKYFNQILEEKSDKLESAAEVRSVLEEVEIEILKNSLMKLYLEDFYYFCQELGGDTAEIMGDLLKAKADQRAINITLNSFGTPLNEPTMRSGDGWPTRKSLYPSIGFLYPAGTAELVKVADEATMTQAMERIGGQYAEIWAVHQNEIVDKSIDDAFFEREVAVSGVPCALVVCCTTVGGQGARVNCRRNLNMTRVLCARTPRFVTPRSSWSWPSRTRCTTAVSTRTSS